MSMKISVVEHSEVYDRLAWLMVRERVAIKKVDEKTQYLGMYDGLRLVGVVGWQTISDNHLRYKTDYIREPYRGMGCYSQLWAMRDNHAYVKHDPETISAYCTQMSLPKYLKEGFVEQSVGKNGIIYVKLKTRRNNAQIQKVGRQD